MPLYRRRPAASGVCGRLAVRIEVETIGLGRMGASMAGRLLRGGDAIGED